MPIAIKVETSARLHLGFLDLSGTTGRKFGSLGLAIDQPVTRLVIARSDRLQVEGPERDRAATHLAALRKKLGLAHDYSVTIEEAIPAHAGLGSGTQLALALATALRRLEELPSDLEHDALFLRRGSRSGIGAALFSTGGVIVDGGHGAEKALPPILCRLPFPEDWRVILVIDDTVTGVHGDAESEAFAHLPPFPEAQAANICRAVLMQALPALVERDLPAFGAAISRIQTILGDYFAPAQGGTRYTSSKIGAVMAALKQHGAQGIGQSSWGPTGFAFAESAEVAERLVHRVRESTAHPDAVMLICKGMNEGARVETIRTPQIEGQGPN